MLAGQIGARGQSACARPPCDFTSCRGGRLPRLGLHEQTPPAGLDYRLGARRAGPFERRALGGEKWFTEPKLGAKAGRRAG